MPFSFEALTDWSRHEPAVTLRAQKLFTALPWGIVPPLGERAAGHFAVKIHRRGGFAQTALSQCHGSMALLRSSGPASAVAM